MNVVVYLNDHAAFATEYPIAPKWSIHGCLEDDGRHAMHKLICVQICILTVSK